MNRRSVSVALLIVLSFVGTAAYRGTIPVASFYVSERLERTAFAVGLLTTSFYLLRAVAAVSSGYLAETARRARLIATTSFLLQVIVTLYLMTKPSYLGVILVRGSQGVLNGLAWTSAQVLLASVVPRGFRGRAFAVYGISGSLGSLIGDLMYKFVGFRCLLISMFLFLLSSAIVFSAGTLVEKVSKGELLLDRRRERGSRSPADVPLSFLLLSMLAISYVSVMGIADIAYVYYRDMLGMTKGDTALLRGSSSFLGTIIGFFLGWLADKGETKKVLISVYLISIMGTLLISVPKVIIAATGIAILTASSRVFLPIARKVASELPRGNVYLGVVGALGNLGAALGGVGFGYFYTAFGTGRIWIYKVELAKAPVIATLWTFMVPLFILVRSRRSN